jgi:hypothetical protein
MRTRRIALPRRVAASGDPDPPGTSPEPQSDDIGPLQSAGLEKGLVGVDDPAFVIEHRDEGDAAVDQRPEPRLVLPHRLFGARAVGDVEVHADHSGGPRLVAFDDLSAAGDEPDFPVRPADPEDLFEGRAGVDRGEELLH